MSLSGGDDVACCALIVCTSRVAQVCKTVSDPWLDPCAALTTLLQASKKACEVVVKNKGFALPKAGTPAGKPGASRSYS